jgi:hypothetical protein
MSSEESDLVDRLSEVMDGDPRAQLLEDAATASASNGKA